MLAQPASATNINMKVLKFLASDTKRQCQMAQVKIMKAIKRSMNISKESYAKLKFEIDTNKSSEAEMKK
jgi:hypothetical protein